MGRKRSSAASSSAPPAEPEVILLALSDEEEAVVEAPAKRRSTRIAKPPESQALLTFPSAAAKDSITLTYGDLRRLRQPQGKVQAPESLLLNDNLVDFYVKYISAAVGPSQEPGICRSLLPGLTAAARDRVHIFNAFFLKRLRMTLSQKKDLSGLLKWVQHVDLFKKVSNCACFALHADFALPVCRIDSSPYVSACVLAMHLCRISSSSRCTNRA